jgi:Protein of unknown function (DUF998)
MATLPHTSLKKYVNVTERLLLICGILSSLFYVCEDALAGTLWQGYNFTSQAFSDYSAVDAPTRPLILLLSPIYTALIIAFGLGVWWSAGQKRVLRFIGVLLVIYALVSLVWPQFFPIHLYTAEATSSDTMHIVLTVVTVLSWLLMLGFAAISFGKRFRLYSIGTLLTVLLFGALSGFIAWTTRSAVTQSAPWFGIIERIILYSFMLWVIVLAITLLRAQSTAAQHNPQSK